MSAYNALLERLREVQLVASTGSLLSWDQETGLPPSAANYRAEQLAWFSGWAHRQSTGEDFKKLLEAAEEEFSRDPDAPANDPDRATNLRETRRTYERAVRLPTSLVEEFARTCSQSHHAWVAARAQSDFSLFAPSLMQLLQLCRAQADCWGYADEPYDALLEGYEPGTSTANVAALLTDLSSAQSELLQQIIDQAAPPTPWPTMEFPIEAQIRFNREVATAFGFDFQAGRIDPSTHPFCTTLGPRDIRLTTRYEPGDFTSSLYSVLHEAGHGLYEQGLPPEHFGLPTGEAVSLGLHESQSRLWENKVGRTVEFWEYWLPRAIEYFPAARQLTPALVAAHVLQVRPSFIRVEADEVSYDLHIALRFEMERALLNNDLAVPDLPAAWNSRFTALFGLEVPHHAHGCLQDIHWSMGGFGYFPTYSLGNLHSAQLFAAARRALPDFDTSLASGNYSSLLTWLRENIHRHGKHWNAATLIEKTTGAPSSITPHLDYLRGKYLPG